MQPRQAAHVPVEEVVVEMSLEVHCVSLMGTSGTTRTPARRKGGQGGEEDGGREWERLAEGGKMAECGAARRDSLCASASSGARMKTSAEG